MDFRLSQEQLSIFETAREFAVQRLAPDALEWDQDKIFPVAVLREAADLGMAGICVTGASGGAGLSRLDAALIFEALGYGCPTIAAYLSIHNMCAWMVDRFGSAEVRERFLPRLLTMEHLSSYCLTEPGAGSDAAALRTRAQADGSEIRLNGAKSFISGGGVSDLYVVMARTGLEGPSGISAFLVEKDRPGLSFGKNEKKMGWHAQPTTTVTFENCCIPRANLLGEEGSGFKYAMMALDAGRLNIAACALGAAQAGLDKSLAYLRDRHAFGKPLDQFQALQFRLADMETDLQAARILLRQAAWKLDQQEPDATKFCAMAKRFVTDAAFNTANMALQLHGGYGYLADHGIEKIVRDLRVHQILEGTNEIMRLIIARELLKERG